MSMVAAPKLQTNHKYINHAIDRWLDIHFGDTSFNGRVVIGRRKNGGGIYTMTVRSLGELRPYVRMIHASPRLDYYITANTVSGVNRRESELFGLQNIVIDIDCHATENRHAVAGLVQAFLWRSKRDLWETGVVPTPNSIVRTGRGVQLWWAIQPCYGGRGYSKSRYHYNKIKNNIMDHIEAMLAEYPDEMEGLEVDRGASSNPVGYFRLPCTYNTVAKCYGTLEILHDKRYDQRDLTLLEAPESDVPSQGQSGAQHHIPLKKSDIAVIHNYHSTGLRRVMQLVKLRNLRDNEAGNETRDHFNFAVYNSLRMTFEHGEAMERLRAFNDGFNQPMSEKELENCISSARKKRGYKYSNAKLIELLSITSEEQDAIGLHPFRGSYRPWAHSKPNESRDAARRAIREDRDHKIITMHEEGVSQAEISRRLGIGKNTVGRVLKKQYTEIEKTDVSTEVVVAQEERHHFGSMYVLNTMVSPKGGHAVSSNLAPGAVSMSGRQLPRGLIVLPKSRGSGMPPDQ